MKIAMQYEQNLKGLYPLYTRKVMEKCAANSSRKEYSLSQNKMTKICSPGIKYNYYGVFLLLQTKK